MINHISIIKNAHKNYCFQEKSSEGRTHALLDVILKKGDPGFEAFIKALVVSEQSHIAKCLDEEMAAKYISQLPKLTSFERPGKHNFIFFTSDFNNAQCITFGSKVGFVPCLLLY